jgi:hypothetical protein
MARNRAEEQKGAGGRGDKGTKDLFHLRHPSIQDITNNYGHWCFYSTNPALLGSFIFVRAAHGKHFPAQAPS